MRLGNRCQQSLGRGLGGGVGKVESPDPWGDSEADFGRPFDSGGFQSLSLQPENTVHLRQKLMRLFRLSVAIEDSSATTAAFQKALADF